MLGCRRGSRFAVFAAAVATIVGPVALAAQDQPPQPPPNCTYESCALGLAPAWNGLAVTRGISGRQIANLGFFWPTDIRPLFAGDAAALEAATEALQMRTVAAAFTDAGLLLVATGLARAGFQREFDGFSQALTGVGAASIGISIPLQFAADGYLSRAVWWYNRRFARP